MVARGYLTKNGVDSEKIFTILIVEKLITHINHVPTDYLAL